MANWAKFLSRMRLGASLKSGLSRSLCGKIDCGIDSLEVSQTRAVHRMKLDCEPENSASNGFLE
jgi:hypothetical protein